MPATAPRSSRYNVSRLLTSNECSLFGLDVRGEEWASLKDPFTLTLTDFQVFGAKMALEWCYMQRKTPVDRLAWEVQLFNLGCCMICEVAAAAYYLDMKPLVEFSCGMLAKALTGLTAEEMRTALRVENDFSAEEEASFPRDVIREFR